MTVADNTMVPASPLVRYGSNLLTFDPEGIESVEFVSSIDAIDVTPPGAKVVERKLGKSHIELKITFKDGHRPKWTDTTEVEEG